MFRDDLKALGFFAAFKIAVIAAFVLLGGSLYKLGYVWDARIYMRIASLGYLPIWSNASDYVFAPLFPFLISLSHLGYVGALLIANVFALGTVYLIYKLSNLTAALLFGAVPTFLLFGSAAYADSMMLFFLVLAYYSYVKGNYLGMWGAVTFSFLAKYAALLAAPFFFCLFVWKLRSAKDISSVIWGVGGIIIPVLGLGSVMFWLQQVTGDPLAFIHYQSYWGANGIVDPITQAQWLMSGWFVTQPAVRANTMPFFWLIRNYAFQIPIMVMWLYAAWKRSTLALLGLPFAVLTFLTIGMPAISVPRIILPSIVFLPIVYSKSVEDVKYGAYLSILLFTITGMVWLVAHANGAFIA